MTERRTLTVSITPEQDALVRSCPRSGRYAGASKVVRAALRLLDRMEEQPGIDRPRSLEGGVTADA